MVRAHNVLTHPPLGELTIMLNGTPTVAYDTQSHQSINITPDSIGAAVGSHNHDSVYSKLGHIHTPAQSGAAPASHSHTAAQVGAAASNHGHTAAQVGAAAANHSHTPASIGAAPKDFILKNQTISASGWVNNVFTISNSGILANHIAEVFFAVNDIEIGNKMNIKVWTEAGRLCMRRETVVANRDLFIEAIIFTPV